MINIKINQTDLAKLNLLLGGIEKGAATVISRSINKGVDGGSPEAKAALKATFNIKAGSVTKNISLTKSSVSRLQGMVVVDKDVYGRGKGLGVIDFSGGRQYKKTGYRVTFQKKTINLQHAFKAVMKTGHAGVFVRNFDKVTRKSLKGIREIFSTSVSDALRNTGNLKQFEENLAKRMINELARQTNLLLGRL